MNKPSLIIHIFMLLFVLSSVSLSNQLDMNQRFPPLHEDLEKDDKFWYSEAEAELLVALRRSFNSNTAKNVILFIGDGMGVTVSTAGRIFKGQKKGFSGTEEYLAWEKFPNHALIKTYNVDKQVPDSAGTATAYLCGVKANLQTIGVNANVQPYNCSASLDSKNRPDSILKWSQDAGKGTGVITTTRITHATPSASYAHSASRNWECDSLLPEDAKEKGCKDIARQLVEDLPGKNINVLLAGGRDPLGASLPEDENPISNKNDRGDIEDGESTCKREDGRNLANEWISEKTDAGKSAVYVTNTKEFKEVDPAKEDYILGLFEGSHMDFSYYRDESPKGSPSIKEMTELAIKRLQRETNGFFLLVEGGRIDMALHDTRPRLALEDLVAFDEAVQAALDMVNLKETLIIVTADHSHSMTMSGYPPRDNSILGTTIMDSVTDKMPYTTLMFTTGPGATFTWDGEKVLRRNLTGVDTTDPEFVSQSSVPTERYCETHGGEDVALYAIGPMSHLFHTLHEQSYITHVMGFASGVGPYKDNLKERVKRLASPKPTFNMLRNLKTKSQVESQNKKP